MTNEELRKYYNEQKLQGRSESQIARSLGMSLAHLMGKLNGVDVNKVDPPKPKKDEKKSEPKTKQKTKLPPPEKIGEGVYREPWENAEQRIKTGDFDFGEDAEKEEPKPEEDLSWMND